MPKIPDEPRKSLSDEEVTAVRVNRRSFLAKAALAGSVTMGAALSTACGDDSSDSCDSDRGPDTDRCDSD